MRQAYREVRVELGEHLTTDGLSQVLADLEARGWKSFKTSAKEGASVEDVFVELGRRMLPPA